MRIIQGSFKGYQFPNYKGGNTRPSSDLLKESLFNSLEGVLDLSNCRVLDLFAGTGNIGLECLSRGAAQLSSVDHMASNCKYMQAVGEQLNLKNWQIIKKDSLQFLDKNTESFDFIFADPPYDYPHIHELYHLILDASWFHSRPSVFILEHVDRLVIKHNSVFLNKQYGDSAITGFKSETF